MKKSLRFTDANFKEEVLDCRIPVLVDFWGSWCPPCKMVEPIMDELADEFEARIRVGRINVDQNPKSAATFNISGVPTFVLFKEDRILRRKVGVCSKQQLLEMIKEAAKAGESD